MSETVSAVTLEDAGSQLQFETVACDLCHSTESIKVLDGVDWEFGRQETFSIVRCKNCSLVYQNPRPALSSIPFIYPPAYGFYQKSRGLQRFFLWRFPQSVYYRLAYPYPYLKGIKPGRILDVGCATGRTNYPYGRNGSLLQLKKLGWDVSGLEFDPKAAEIARNHGITVQVGRLPDGAFLGERFDVIRFNHVLEHSVSPSADLAAAAALLEEGGRIIVSGPNIDSAPFFLFQKYWSGLDLPRHFYHFTPVTLRKYFEAVGLPVQHCYYDGWPDDFLHSTRHFLQSEALIGRNGVCQGNPQTTEDAVTRLFSFFTRACLRVGVSTLTSFFNRIGKSDSFTIVGVRE